MSSNRRHSEWLNECRRKLIEMETKNIRQRALSWSEIVNQETSKINAMLNINLNNFNNNNNNDYIYSVPNPLKYLTFLSEWNGIKTRNTSTEPTSYIEFEAKAKNWLNGRRAPNYGNTLFPDMIKSSYNYSNKLSILIFGNIPINKLSTTPNGDSLQNLYHKTLLFAYLHKLCSERIAVHQSWKKTNLLCENSVKNMHSNTAKLLQQYAIHDYTKNDLNSFPGNLQRSSAFFNEQHNAYLMRLSQAYNAYNNQSSHNNNKRNMNDMNNIIGGNMNNMIHSNNMRNDLNVNYVAIKSSEYANIMERLSALEQKHNDQATQISTLTTKCHALQQQIEATNAPSTIASIPSTSGGVHQYIDKLSSNENDPEYYNDQSYNSMDCSIQTSTTNTNNAMINKLVMHKSHSPSINSHHSQHDPNTQVQVQVQYNMQSQPMPFQASRSLPPQLNLPPFHPQSNIINTTTKNEPKIADRKSFDLSYPNPPITSSNSVPQYTNQMNNNNNYNTYNYNDYGLALHTQNPSAGHGIPTYNIYPNNSNPNQDNTNNNSNSMPNDYNMYSMTPTNQNLHLLNMSDHVMLDHNNSTPTQVGGIFTYSPLTYN